jgi:hypothetical protein
MRLEGNIMDIYRAEKVAQDRMLKAINGQWDKSFVLASKYGIKECEWIDPYLGAFKIKGDDGFMLTSDIPAGIEILMADDKVTVT